MLKSTCGYEIFLWSTRQHGQRSYCGCTNHRDSMNCVLVDSTDVEFHSEVIPAYSPFLIHCYSDIFSHWNLLIQLNGLINFDRGTDEENFNKSRITVKYFPSLLEAIIQILLN